MHVNTQIAMTSRFTYLTTFPRATGLYSIEVAKIVIIKFLSKLVLTRSFDRVCHMTFDKFVT